MPGKIGLVASATGTVFAGLNIRRIDWPAPATPAWQVYEGTFALGTSTASQAPVEGSVLNLNIWRMEDGQPQDAGSWSYSAISDTNQPRHLHIRTADDDLEVWVYLDGDWQCAVDPDYAGYDLLAGSPGGAVGLTCDSGGDTAVCSLLRMGSLASGHTFSSGQAAVAETFASTFSTTRDIPEKLEYDAAGNIWKPIATITYYAVDRTTILTSWGTISA